MTERHIARLTVAMTQLFQISPDQARVAIAIYRARSGLSYQRIYALLTTGQLRYRGGELRRPLMITLKIRIPVGLIEAFASIHRAAESASEAAANTSRSEAFASIQRAAEAFRESAQNAMDTARWSLDRLWPVSAPPLPRGRSFVVIDDPRTPSPLVMPRFASCPGCEYFHPEPLLPCAVNPAGPPDQPCPDRA